MTELDIARDGVAAVEVVIDAVHDMDNRLGYARRPGASEYILLKLAEVQADARAHLRWTEQRVQAEAEGP